MTRLRSERVYSMMERGPWLSEDPLLVLKSALSLAVQVLAKSPLGPYLPKIPAGLKALLGAPLPPPSPLQEWVRIARPSLWLCPWVQNRLVDRGVNRSPKILDLRKSSNSELGFGQSDKNNFYTGYYQDIRIFYRIGLQGIIQRTILQFCSSPRRYNIRGSQGTPSLQGTTKLF